MCNFLHTVSIILPFLHSRRSSILGNLEDINLHFPPTLSSDLPLMRYHKYRLGLSMFVIVWQFEISEEKIAAFEAAYAPEGAWAQLFRASEEYCGTELLRDAYIAGNYLTIDRWSSEEAFRAFRKEHDAAYETLDRACDSLTSRETRIGAYTV
jgi:heme-degrading monooxygenase HmoA